MKSIVRVVAVIAALSSYPQPAGTEDLPRRALSRQSAEADIQLALLSDARLGVWRNFDDAVGWFRMRAAQGDAAAEYELAHLQFTGLLPQRAEGETLRLLTSAAEAGHDQAQLLLARIHEFGIEGTRPDLVQALKWSTRAVAAASTDDLRASATEAAARLRARMSPTLIAQAETLAALGWSDGR